MNPADLSNLAMVSATVVYVCAMIAHATEWAMSHHAERSHLAGRIGVSLSVVAWLVHAVGVVSRGVAAHRLPWGNMYEFTTSALLVIVAAYLISLVRLQVQWLGLLVTLLASIGLGLAVTVWYVQVGPLMPALHSVWFVIHIVAAIVAAAGFNLGALTAVVYLIKSRVSERPDSYLARVPSVERLDLLSFRWHAFAFPVWTFTVVAGAIWAQYSWGRPWNWDPKETWALITWIVYAGYLHARLTAGWKGRKAAILALVGCATFWFNFIGVNLLFPGLHAYAK